MTTQSQEVSTSLPPSKYNILKKLANIKEDASLLDMVIIPEQQQQHMKNYMERKTYTIDSLFEKHDEYDLHVNKLGVNNFRNSIKKSSLLCFYKNNG
jgi:hypothetical protein